MYLDTLFVACLAVVYLEPVLSRMTGRKTATLLTLASVYGICWLLAIFIVGKSSADSSLDRNSGSGKK